MTLRQCLSGAAGISSVVTSGCIDGSGTLLDPVYLKVDPTGLLVCGAGGLRYSGPSGGGVDNLGNHIATKNLYMNGFGISGVSGVWMSSAPPTDNNPTSVLVRSTDGRVSQKTISSITLPSVVNWSHGQVGSLIADGTMVEQPRFVVPSGYTIDINYAIVTLGKPGVTTTTLHSAILNDTGDGSPPTPGSPTSTFNIESGIVYKSWDAMVGQTLSPEQHLQTRVETPGSGAEGLSIHFWGTLS